MKARFGNLGAFVKGNMVTGLFASDVGLKLPADALADVRRAGGGPFRLGDRPMAGYVTLPPMPGLVDAWIARHSDQPSLGVSRWVRRPRLDGLDERLRDGVLG